MGLQIPKPNSPKTTLLPSICQHKSKFLNVLFFRWKCQCFTSDSLDKLIGAPKNLGRIDPTQDVTLNAMEAETKGNFENDVALKTFITSTKELKNSKSTDIGAIDNVCNPERTVNVATVYLAKALGLDVRSLVEDYTYNWATSHSFPMNSTHGPSQTFEPTGDNAQAYWTVLDQYTAETEPELRDGKGQNWCHHQGIGVHSHCIQVWRHLFTHSVNPSLPDGSGLRHNLCHC